MNVGVPGLALLMLCGALRLGLACVEHEQTLICRDIPSTFRPGFSSLVILMSNVGVINSTVLHSDQLVSVTNVNIGSSGVTGISPGALASFPNLQNLSLTQNALVEISPAWFGRPAALQDLDLRENHIEVLNESTLSGLTGLTRLNLARNRIGSLDVRSFSDQTSLVHLDLSGNKLTQVPPRAFGPLRSTLVRLDGNPWDCSCGAGDFVVFLKDLHNRSLLEREMEVTCEHPASLRGQPVWNVSVCMTTPHAPPISATPTSVPPTWTLPKVEASPRPLPTDAPSIAPTLIGVIVFLSALLVLVCILAVLYRRKRVSGCLLAVQVKPGSSTEENSEEHGGFRRSKLLGDPEKRGFMGTIHRVSERARRGSVTGVRAKSANAVLTATPFSGAGNNPSSVGSQMTDSSPSGDTQNIAEGGQTLETEAESVDVHGERETGQDTDINTNSVPVNAEMAPYLSIGSEPPKPNPEPGKGQPGKGQPHQPPWQRAPMARVSTWPTTSVQWQARCRTGVQAEEPSVFTIPITRRPYELGSNHEPDGIRPGFEGEVQAVSRGLEMHSGISPAGGDVEVQESPSVDVLPLEGNRVLEDVLMIDSATALPLVLSEPVTYEMLSQVEDAIIEDLDSEPNETKDPSPGQLPSSRTDPSADEEEPEGSPEKVILTSPNVSEEGRTHEVGQLGCQMESQAHEDPEMGDDSANPCGTASRNKREVMNIQKQVQSKHSSRDQGGSRTPSDYAYMDLLHEVVQNHGRWTRERWKQTHLRKPHLTQQGEGSK